MRRWLKWALILYALFDWFIGYGGLLPLSLGQAASFTQVSGTVTDPGGIPYAFGTITAHLVVSATPTFSGGGSFDASDKTAGLDRNGSFAFQLADNTQVSPGGSTWSFTVCSAGGTVQPSIGKGSVCFTIVGVTISGTSQSITATLNAAALALSGRLGPPIIDMSKSPYSCVADDSTNNDACITAVNAAIAAYAGPGQMEIWCSQGIADTAYKLTNTLVLSKSAKLAGGCAIDCKQTSGSCIQQGPSGLAAFTDASLPYEVDDITLLGLNAGAAKGIQCMPYVSNCGVTRVKIRNTGTASNTVIYADSPNPEVHWSDNWVWNTDGVTGRNIFHNSAPAGGLHSNTLSFLRNHVISATAPGFTGPCGGVGLYTGGWSGTVKDSDFYGFGANILVSNSNLDGLAIDNVQLDHNGCNRLGVTANIQFGDTGVTGGINFLSITNSQYNGYNYPLFALAADTTAVTFDHFTAKGNKSLLQSSPMTQMTLAQLGTNVDINNNQAASNGAGGGVNAPSVLWTNYFSTLGAALSTLPSFDLGLFGQAYTFRMGFFTAGSTAAVTDNLCPFMFSKSASSNQGQIYCDFANVAGGGFFVRSRDTSSGNTYPALSIPYQGDVTYSNGSLNEIWNAGTAVAPFGATKTNGVAICETLGASTILSTGSTTTNTGLNCLPTNAIIDAVTYFVTQTITTAANYTIGDATIAARFCASQTNLTAGLSGTCFAQADQTGTSGPKQTSVAAVRITTNVNPGAGKLRLFVFYHTWTPSTL